VSCSADLPSVGRSAAVEATKEEKPQTVRKRRSALHWTSKKSPLERGGWRATAVAAADGVGGWSRLRYNPPQGLAVLAPPKRGFTFPQK
jgi:hypothetical protein